METRLRSTGPVSETLCMAHQDSLSLQGSRLGRYTGRDPKGWWWCTGTTSIQLVQSDMDTRRNPSGAARRYHSSHLQTKRISLSVTTTVGYHSYQCQARY